MTVHFHVGKTPFTLQAGAPAVDQERADKDLALIWYALHFPREGQIARYVLRKWAGGAR